MNHSLHNQRILITGASSGIGAGIARAFGACGARVLVHYRGSEAGAQRTVQQIDEAGGTGSVVQADLRAEAAIDRLFAHIDAMWGGVDVLVNNAGIVHKGSALDTTSDYWDNALNLNLRAPYLLSRHAARRMIDGGTGGSILNITSIAGTRSGAYMSAYAASKAALDALTRSLAVEWAQHNIRVNAIAPGVIPVERQQERLFAAEEAWMAKIPLGRFGTPEDVGALAAFLCSDAAAWITGQTYICDGGALAQSSPPGEKPELPPPPSPVEEAKN